MMKVNELRIGNWVTLVNKDIFKNIDYQIDAFDIYKASEFPDLSEAMLPIPLNEEWLLKFGFESNKEFTYTKNFNAVELYDECIEFFFEPNEEVCITLRQMESDNHNEISSVFIRKIMYVHQLQNLYWFLTNEELTLKP